MTDLRGGIRCSRVIRATGRDSGANRPARPADCSAEAHGQSRFSGETCQCEAIAPDMLSQIVRHAVAERTDHQILERVMQEELVIRQELQARLGLPPPPY